MGRVRWCCFPGVGSMMTWQIDGMGWTWGVWVVVALVAMPGVQLGGRVLVKVGMKADEEGVTPV